MSANPTMTSIIISIIANVCVNSSDRSKTLRQLLSLLWLVSIFSSLQIIVFRTSTRTNAANSTSTTFILFARVRFNTIAFTSTISTTIMITVIITTISIAVAATIALPSIVVNLHIIMIIVMMNTIVAIIVTLVSNCIMNVTTITASNNANISIPAPVLLLSLLLLVLVPSSAH